MTTTPQSMSDHVKELTRVGALLSNAAYNLAQHADLSPEMRESLDKLRKQWDAARDAYTLCRATAEQAGKVEGFDVIHQAVSKVGELGVDPARYRHHGRP